MRKDENKIKDERERSLVERRDHLVRFLYTVIRYAVRVLAVLMVMVILWGIGDVIFVLYQKLREPPFLLLDISDILATFGAFLAVLISIEIFINIILYLKDPYLRDHVIHVKLVIATALMAVARKVIVFDYNVLSYVYVWATAIVILALALTYWLIARKTSD